MSTPSSLVYDVEENKDLKSREPIYMMVKVLDKKDIQTQYLVDFSYFNTKTWLINTLVWATHQGKTITVRAATDNEIDTCRMFIPKDKR